MSSDLETTLVEVEETQPILRECIETVKVLTKEVDRLIKLNRQEQSDEGGTLA